MPALVVPTIFTAVDKMSGTIQKMQRSVGGFAGKASIGINALNNGLNKLVPSFGGILKRYGRMAADFAFFTLAAFSVKSILDYEQSLAHLHGLLNNLSDSGFKPYQKEVDRVAKVTQYSAAAVADAFTKISERNIDLAKTPGSLGAVTEAAITLSRAAKMELVPATEALVNVLFQFGLQGKDSGRVINVLAAGMKYGSSSIENQIEAYKKFAVTARGANITLEQSNALIQTIAHQVQGSDAGTALRNILLNLEKYKNLYKNGKFDIGYALDTVAAHLVKLGSEQKRNIFLQDLFGKRSVNAARQLLENIPLYRRLTQAVTGTNEAQRIAEKNMDNVKDTLGRLVNAYTAYITSNENTLPGLKKLKDAIRYVTNNIDKIIETTITIVKWFLILKGVLLVLRTALVIYNVAMGVTAAVTGIANIAIGESAVAMGAYRSAVLITTVAQGMFNRSILATAIRLGATSIFGAAGMLALGAFYVYEIDKNWKSWGDSVTAMLGPLGEVFNLIEQIKGGSNKQLALDVKQGGIGGFARSYGDVIQEYAKSFGRFTSAPYKGIASSLGYNLRSYGDPDTEKRSALASPLTSVMQAQKDGQSSASKNYLGIDITAPPGYGVSTKQHGDMNIPVKSTSTTGKK